MMWGNGWWGQAGWAWFNLMHVVWWLLVFVGIVALVRWIAGNRRNPANDSQALNILRERFARGEIDKNEYEERKRILKG